MIESYITSSIEGRFRIRHPFIMNVGLADAIFTFLKGQDNIDDVKINVACGSVLIKYNPEKNTQDNIIANLEEFSMAYCIENDYLEQLLEYEENMQKKAGTKVKPKTNIPIVWAFDKLKGRILLRRSMFGLLATSVALIALNQERGHVLTGSIFVSLAAAHLYINRKRF